MYLYIPLTRTLISSSSPSSSAYLGAVHRCCYYYCCCCIGLSRRGETCCRAEVRRSAVRCPGQPASEDKAKSEQSSPAHVRRPSPPLCPPAHACIVESVCLSGQRPALLSSGSRGERKLRSQAVPCTHLCHRRWNAQRCVPIKALLPPPLLLLLLLLLLPHSASLTPTYILLPAPVL